MAEILDIAALPSLEDVGFTAGRDSFRDFCKRIFRGPEPRFLKNEHDQLVVFRNADLRAFGAAPEVGNVPIGKLYPNRYKEAREKLPGWEIGEVIGKQVFTYNPPLHGPARRILTSWLSPKQVALMETTARSVARKIIAEIGDDREIDFVEQVAERLIIGFWGKLLKLTERETADIGRYAHDMTRLFIVNRTPEDYHVLDNAFLHYSQILSDVAERGLAAGDPDLMAIADKLKELNFEDDPYEVGIVPKSVGAVLAGNLVDGVHTAALAAANTFHALIRDEAALAAIRQSPELLPKAISEALRLDPPVLFLSRYMLKDFHYDGLVVPAGNIVTMLWAAGNHDPAAFQNPETFDLTRSQVGLTTFGGGIHICPGRYVGVMLVRVLVEEFEAGGVICAPGSSPAAWYPSHKMGQLKVMPVKLTRRQD